MNARVRQHEENAQLIANVLHGHADVEKVYYPGLPDHAGHEIAARQQRGFGGMLSFELRGGDEAVRRFLESLSFFSLAESLGGVESLVCHPASMTHAPVAPAALENAGIGRNLIRLSVGIESADDLVADLINALANAQPKLAVCSAICV